MDMFSDDYSSTGGYSSSNGVILQDWEELDVADIVSIEMMATVRGVSSERIMVFERPRKGLKSSERR